MKIELRERLDSQVWLLPLNTQTPYYRAEMPARMTGGAVLRSFRASFDGEPVESVGLSREFFSRLPFCETLTLYGMGTPTVIPFLALAQNNAQSRTCFCDALCSVPGFMIDLDDPPIPRAYNPQAVADELTRICMMAVVTGDTSRITGVFSQPMVKVIEESFSKDPRLPTPEELCFTHDFMRAKILAGLQEEAKAHKAMAFDVLLHIREVVAATAPLEEVLRTIAPRLSIRVAPNAVDPADFQDSRKPNDGVVRIGFCSTWGHTSDAELIMPALRECARLPNTEVWFFGWHPAWSRDLVVDRPKVLEWAGLTYHHGGLFTDTREFFRASSVLDVALAPLQNDLLINQTRSSSKWFESAMWRTPMVVSDMPPYECVEHGVTGLKAHTAEEFTEYAVQLCKDAELRARIGGAAYDAVTAHHTIAACAEQWRRACVYSQEKGEFFV